MANILGINLSELSFEQVLKKINEFLKGDEQRYVVTPNPEIILSSHQDEELFYILNKADLAPADGFGLQLAGFISGVKIPRVTGADLTSKLLELAAREGTKTSILNWQNGLSKSEEIKRTLSEKFPGLNFIVININRVKLLPPEIINQINAFGPALLFTNLGFPYQEKVLFHNLKKLNSVRVGLGVGGSFDFLTGQAIRAPKIFRTLGLEWLWRLIKQPSRWKRIYRATAVFTIRILKARFIYPFLYRPNVACLLYKKEGNAKKILLVEREDDSNHWQLPQGGTDGEDIATAGTREIREELGANNIVGKGVFKNLYRFEFSSGNNKKVYQATSIQRHAFDYKGQKQGLFVAEFLGRDEEIKINFWDHVAWKWVDANKLIEEVHPIRRTSAKIFLAKFKSLNL